MMVIVSAVVGTGNFYHLCSKLRHLPPFYRLICLLFALFTPPIPGDGGKEHSSYWMTVPGEFYEPVSRN